MRMLDKELKWVEYAILLHDAGQLVVPDDVEEMITLFHTSGGYTYVDPYGEALGIEDVFSKLAAMRKHYALVGLGTDYADQFIR